MPANIPNVIPTTIALAFVVAMVAIGEPMRILTHGAAAFV